MSWVEIALPSTELAFRANGKIAWNSALQLMMGDPAWVDLMWDAAERTLGIRAVNSPTGFPVSPEPEGSEYMIDSADALDAAGISVDENVSGAPESWQETKAGTGWNEWFGYNPIHYITIPE